MRRIGVVVAGVVAAGLSACESTQSRSTPGAPPAQQSDVTPQINASTYVAHGNLLERQGKYEAAATQYHRALELTPDLLVARNRLGITLNRMGKHAEASEQFRKVLERSPKVAYVHNNLGFSLYLEGKYPEAERELARALELTAAFPRARMNHALALARLGRFDEALTEFRLVCSEADACYNVSIIQAEAGRYAEAARSLERALQAQPDFEAAREQLREISRLAAEQEEAERVAAEIAAAAKQQPVPSVPPGAGDQTGASTSDVQTAANVEAVPVTESGASAGGTNATGDVDPAKVAEQIRAMLAAAEGPMPSDEAALGAVGHGELIAMLDKLIDVSIRGAPWWDGCLQRLRDVLAQPQPVPSDGNLQTP